MANAEIKFGTSGWRAIVADDFTHANVRRAVTGIARYVIAQKPAGAKILVGRDPRYMGETFVEIAAEVLARTFRVLYDDIVAGRIPLAGGDNRE